MVKITSSFDYPDPDALYLKVALKISEQSMRSYLADCVRGNQQRMRNIYRDRIEAKARELNITWEECFNLYLNFDPPFTSEMIKKASEMPVIIDRNFAQTNLGNEAK